MEVLPFPWSDEADPQILVTQKVLDQVHLPISFHGQGDNKYSSGVVRAVVLSVPWARPTPFLPARSWRAERLVYVLCVEIIWLDKGNYSCLLSELEYEI